VIRNKQKIEPGKSEVLSITLNDGYYVSVSISLKGKINFFLLNPDGSIARRLIDRTDAKASFPFAAEGAGAYSFKLENKSDQPASYELTTSEVTTLNERFKPEPWTDPFPSARIEALRKQIAAGQTNTDSFWKQVAAEKTSLVEPYGSDGKYQLVTFLWRSIHDTRNVFVRGSFLGVGPPADY
jgi:hypothetical protein